MSKTLPLSEVKAKLSEVVDEVASTQERITITRNGRPIAVLLSSHDLEVIEETLEILSDPVALRALEQARQEVATGDVVGREELLAETATATPTPTGFASDRQSMPRGAHRDRSSVHRPVRLFG